MASFLSSPTSPTHSTPLLLFSSAAERILVLSHLQGEGEMLLVPLQSSSGARPSLFSLLLLSHCWLGCCGAVGVAGAIAPGGRSCCESQAAGEQQRGRSSLSSDVERSGKGASPHRSVTAPKELCCRPGKITTRPKLVL